jgi:hypothetical protein
MSHREAMADMILELLNEYAKERTIPYWEVLGAIDDAQCRLTEKLIIDYPEIKPTLSDMMAK